MAQEIIRPVDEDSARAIEQTAILGQKLTDAAIGSGGYLASILGRLPHNLVGIVDDRVAFYRAQRLKEMTEDLEKDLRDQGVKERVEPSFTVLLPLVEAAIDENRAELKSVWRRLLANAFHPDRSSRVRGSFVEVVKKMDPLDAVVLQRMVEAGPGTLGPNARDFLRKSLELSIREILLSFDNLKKLGLLDPTADPANPQVSDRGHLLIEAIRL
jgi:hypothetical protein